jgi:hypothetical protein
LKKKGKDSVQTAQNQFTSSEGTGYDFPEIEEYFIYTPGGQGGNSSASGFQKLKNILSIHQVVKVETVLLLDMVVL